MKKKKKKKRKNDWAVVAWIIVVKGGRRTQRIRLWNDGNSNLHNVLANHLAFASYHIIYFLYQQIIK